MMMHIFLRKFVSTKSRIRIILFFSFVAFILNNANAQWLTGYGFRKPIEIDESYIPGTTDLTDYTFLVNIIDPNQAHTSSSGYVGHINGYDIDFTLSDGITTMDFEIEEYDNATGELVAWVRIPTLSDTTNTNYIKIYRSKSDAVDSSDAVTVIETANGFGGSADYLEDANSENYLNGQSQITLLTINIFIRRQFIDSLIKANTKYQT